MTRKATIQDLDQLALLFDSYRVFYRKDSDVAAAKDFLRARLQAGDSTIFVVDDAGHLVGFVQLYPIFSSTRMRRLWLLNDLFVTPAARGRGWSLQLIDRAKQLARETDACGLLLETEKTNDIGNRLYPRAGFIRNEVTHFYSWDVD